MESSLSLYLHVPFCRVKCTYCDFNTYVGLDELFQTYTKALAQEIKVMGTYRNCPQVRTIFIGGGTPTVLSIAQLEMILAACHEAFDILTGVEITCEANPGTVREAYLRDLLDLGINRISFGAQSFNPDELQMLGRLHSAEAIGETINAARRARADNLNLDLIYGLPHQTLATWRDTLTKTIALEPEHISLYSLTLEKGTALRAQVVRGELPFPEADLAADMYELAGELLDIAGYTQYEISNWCKPGWECQHNLTYWRNQSYLGCGPGAHSFESDKRWWNVRPVPRYLKLINELDQGSHPHPAMAGFEELDLPTAMGETMILGLRLTQQGVSLVDFERRFGVSPYVIFPEAISKLKTLNLLKEENQRLLLTPQARLLGNQVFMHFLP
jgi:oxygen-independent coproporphyrinogen-3 oxidase